MPKNQAGQDMTVAEYSSIGRIRRIVGSDGKADYMIEFPATYVNGVPQTWETVSIIDLIKSLRGAP